MELSMSGRGNEETEMVGVEEKEDAKINGLSCVGFGEMSNLTLHFMHMLRSEQDLIFQEPTEIYQLLNDPPTIQLEGLTYHQIHASQQLTHVLTQMRNNSPAYQHMTQRKKTYYMKRIAEQYNLKMKICQDLQEVKEAQSVRDMSQCQSSKNTNQNSDKSEGLEIPKQKIIKKLQKKKKQHTFPKPKRLQFLTQSDCKYFSSPNPPLSIQALPLHFFLTC